ncbi:MAG: hypothetical protein K6F05_00180 [Succinivibrio sp.]|nr:hypothetical protein [Succinivibrio sp.]
MAEVSTFTGKEYLMMDVASMFGLDKRTWGERLNWFNAHEPELEKLVSQADEPNCYLAAVNAYRDILLAIIKEDRISA